MFTITLNFDWVLMNIFEDIQKDTWATLNIIVHFNTQKIFEMCCLAYSIYKVICKFHAQQNTSN